MFDEDLAVYDGDDRVVKSYEAVKIMTEERGSEFMVWAGTTFPSLDKAVEGFQGGELITISGATKNGKTLMAQSLTMAFAKQGKIPLWFTFEVTPSQFFKRFPSIPRITIPLRLRHHDMNWIEDRIVESLLKYGTRIAFIDHLHYLVDMAGSRNISIDIGMVIRRLKGICVERDMVIFLLCHTTKDNARLSYSSIRDCLPAGQVIQSTDGTSFLVENAKKGMSVFSRRSVVSMQHDVITNVWGAGEKDVYKLTTKTGREILASDGHKFYAMSHNKGGEFGPNQRKGIQGWTELKELTVGQKIACVKKYNTIGNQTLTNNQALSLGWIVGDGHITKHFHTEITVSNEKECIELKEIMDDAWGLKTKYTAYKDKNAFRFYAASGRVKNKLAEYFRNNNFNPISREKHTPPEIFTQPEDIVASYLKGLFHADGSINFSGVKSNPMVVVTLGTISNTLAREVKSLLLRVGITGTIREQSMKHAGFRSKVSSIFIISITGQDVLVFMDKIGFVSDKMKRAENIVSQWKPKDRLRPWDICYERVKSLEYVGKMDTYDISVRGHHQSLINNSFCVQDILTHNSSFVSQESDSVIMVSRDPAYNENAAVMTVEFHRRTGVMRRGIALMKVGEMLEEDPRRRIKLKDLNEEEDGYAGRSK